MQFVLLERNTEYCILYWCGEKVLAANRLERLIMHYMHYMQ